MKVSVRWLAGFFAPGVLDALGPEETARRLTLQGLAVDDVGRPFPPFSGVVLGKVLDARPHPGADRLTLCTVTAGERERQVVCGALNVEVGAIYGYARDGAQLPGGRTIRRARIRGIDSEGMLCSAPELGLDALGSEEGIWPVPGFGEEELGRDLREILALDDTILSIDVTSNRGDALCHWGIAREVQWITGTESVLPAIGLDESGLPVETRAGVIIEDEDGCPIYLGRLIDGVRVGKSPAWLQTRLLAVGLRPVNNVVDATNFVMLECGQPLHAFDFARLAGGQIVVRRARANEHITTLDGRERVLDPDMTVIADADAAVAIGGVMGGLDSEVSAGTEIVFLEAANFASQRTGRTARRLGIASEAALRFARGVDPGITGWALDRAAALIGEISGGLLARGRVGISPGDSAGDRHSIALRHPRLQALVGRAIPAAEARRALETLGFVVEEAGPALVAAVPSWRFDVAREVDLIEEVTRLTGYDKVPLAPLPAPPVAPAVDDSTERTMRLAAAARAAGFDEARTPSFVGKDVLGGGSTLDNLVEIRNPISHEERFLRPHVFTTLGGAVTHNLKRGAERVKLFEIGHAFAAPTGSAAPVESRRLALAAAGFRDPHHWSRADAEPYDFFDLKGDVEEILWHGAALRPGFTAGEWSVLHPGRQAAVVTSGGAVVGFCGELHPRIAEAWGADGSVYVAECDLGALSAPSGATHVTDVPREPSAQRDLAIVVPQTHSAADVMAVVESAAIQDLDRIEVFDRYRGPQVEPGHYSLGLRLTFQATRTLTDGEVDERVKRLVDHLAGGEGYRLR